MSRLLALSGETVRIGGKAESGVGFTLTAFDPQAGLYIGMAHAPSRAKIGEIPLPIRMTYLGNSDGLTVLPDPDGGGYPHALVGPIIRFNRFGICGRLKQIPKQGLLWTAEAQKGQAYIITNACTDIYVPYSVTTPSVALPIEITDLADKGWGKTAFSFTGTSLGGMSGSPIIQNGRIVGAVCGRNADKSGVGLHIDQMLEGLYKEAPKVMAKGQKRVWSKARAKKIAVLKKEHMTLTDRLCRTNQGIRYLQVLVKEEPKYQALRAQLTAYEAGRISTGILFERQKRTYPEALKLLWDYDRACWRLALKSWECSDRPGLTRSQRVVLEECVAREP